MSNGHDQRARPVTLEVMAALVGGVPLHRVLGGFLSAQVRDYVCISSKHCHIRSHNVLIEVSKPLQ